MLYFKNYITATKKIKSLLKVLCCIFLFFHLFAPKIFAENSESGTFVSVLKQRLDDEQRLFEISRELYEQVDATTKKILDDLDYDKTEKIKSNNYIFEQLRLQIEKISLQSQRIKIDRDTVEQEIIADENSIYQLENKLQTLASAGRGMLDGVALSINKDIKNLQNSITYYKTVLDINNSRLKILNQHVDLITKLQDVENTKLSRLQRLIDDNIKNENLAQLVKKEAEINSKIRVLLGSELQVKQQIKELDFASLENKVDLPEYNRLQTEVIELTNQRGMLELELSFIRLNSRLSDVDILFESENKEVLKNKKYLSDRVERISKEASAIKQIVNDKISYIYQYKNFIDKEKQVKNLFLETYDKIGLILSNFDNEYKEYLKSISYIVLQLDSYRDKLKDLYLKDVSVRQSLPDSIPEWQALMQDFISVPYLLSKQMFVAWLQFDNYFSNQAGLKLLKIFFLEVLALTFIVFFYQFFQKVEIKYSDISLEKVSTSAFYILSSIFNNNKVAISFIFNTYVLLVFTGLHGVFINIFLLIGLLYVLVSSVINVCYIFLIQNTIEISGDDSRLYKGLKYSLIFGGILSAFMLLGQNLNLSINTLAFIDRLFMLFLLAISYPLIMNWQVVPQLLIDSLQPKAYVRRAIWLLGIIVPVTILSNAALGIIGYVNLAWKIAVAEFQLSMVIALWLIFKGLLSELMELISRFFIRNVTNGWLWAESVLKPLHTVLNFILIIISALGLVFIYGWNSNIELVNVIQQIVYYHLFTITTDTDAPVNIYLKDFIMFCIIFSFVLWATKWSREFSYRWLYNKTKDLAVRNSFSVFTQYATLVVGIIIILKVLGIPTATLMVSIGTLVIFLGFGLRDIISNYISGIILLIERPVRTGDFVTIGDNEGKITKIGMRSLTVQSFDNMEIIVPNTDTITKPIINWTFKDTIIRMDLDLRLSYDENLEMVRELILSILKSNDEILEEPEPRVYFKEFADTAVITRIYFFIDLNKTPSRGSIRTVVMLAINKILTENHIKIAYPKQTVELVKKHHDHSAS